MNLNKSFILSSFLFLTISASCSFPMATLTPEEPVSNAESYEVQANKGKKTGKTKKAPTITPIPTATATNMPSPTASPYPTPVPTVAITPVPQPTVIPTPVPTATVTPSTTYTRRVINFSGYEWLVRNTNGTAGPGPNNFSNSDDNVYVDSQGQLHLKITYRDGKWYCASIGSLKSFGYGKYVFYLASDISNTDPNTVIGLFTWDDDPAYNHREIDIEFTKWGNASDITNSQFVVQPYDTSSNLFRFNTLLSGTNSTHLFDWNPQRINFSSNHGHNITPPGEDFVISNWSYEGSDIPLMGNEKVAINMWLAGGKPPLGSGELEVIIKKFEFVPVN